MAHQMVQEGTQCTSATYVKTVGPHWCNVEWAGIASSK